MQERRCTTNVAWATSSVGASVHSSSAWSISNTKRAGVAVTQHVGRNQQRIGARGQAIMQIKHTAQCHVRRACRSNGGEAVQRPRARLQWGAVDPVLAARQRAAFLN